MKPITSSILRNISPKVEGEMLSLNHRQGVLSGFCNLLGSEAVDPIAHRATVWVVMKSSEGGFEHDQPSV